MNILLHLIFCGIANYALAQSPELKITAQALTPHFLNSHNIEIPSKNNSDIATTFSKTTASKNAKEDIVALIQDALDKVKKIKMMKPGLEYTVMVEGRQERGQKELFLYRRAADEILASGLSSGCGDYATVFYSLMRKTGLDVRFIHAVDLSLNSLLYNFSDHTGVVVSDDRQWILVDPTQGKVISQNWDTGSQIYEDKFWIAFNGPRENFPVKGADQLKKFNKNGLKTVPKNVLNKKISGFDINIDASLLTPDGNPSAEAQSFEEKVSEVFAEYDIAPNKKIELTIVKGGPHLKISYGREGWIVYVSKVTNSYQELRLLSEIDKTDEDLQNLATANKLIRLDFIVDDSMKNPDGTYANPHLPNFLTIGEGIYEKFGVLPFNKATIRLKRGEDNSVSYVELDANGQWVATIGTKSAMELSLFIYLEKTIARD